MPSSITRNLAGEEDYRLFSIGKFKKGSPKINGSYGKNLPYFRFAAKQPHFAEVFSEAYGDKPSKIHVILPYRTAAANFDDWHKQYGASKTGDWFLKRKCDGNTIVQWLPPGESTYSFEPKPCEMKCGGCQCSLTGLLSLYIRDPKREWFLPGFNQGPVILETHSKNDVAHIAHELHHFERELQKFGADLAGSRFVIERQEDDYGTPLFEKGSGKPIPGRRAIKTDWLVKLYPEPEWLEKVMVKAVQTAFNGFAQSLPVRQAVPIHIEPSWVDPLDLVEDESSDLEPVPVGAEIGVEATQNSKPQTQTQTSKPVTKTTAPAPQTQKATPIPPTAPDFAPETVPARFEAMHKLNGCPLNRMQLLSQTHCKKKLSDLTEAEAGKLRNIIVVDWAETAYGEFDVDHTKAMAYFKAFWQECDRALTDEAFFRAWKVFLNVNVFGK